MIQVDHRNESINKCLAIAGKNLIRFLIYFILVSTFVILLFNDDPYLIISELANANFILPNTFATILICSVLFIILTIFISVVAVARQQNHFQTSLVIRIFLFVINALPIVVFQQFLFPKLGLIVICFPIIYFILQLCYDAVVKPNVLAHCVRINASVYKVIQEILVLTLSLVTTFIVIPSEYQTVNIGELDLFVAKDIMLYYIYIILFNSVTFFTVEYYIGIFSSEYKKNHIKFYFLFNRNVFLRMFAVLRNSIPELLEKIRRIISWLVMFILTVESIFENINSIGVNLLDGNHSSDSIIIIRNILYLLIIMYCINTIIDCVLAFSKRINTDTTKEKISDPNTDENKAAHTKINKPALKYCSIALALIVLATIYSFCYREYPFASYYDFTVNQSKTTGDFLKKNNMADQRYDNVLLEKYFDIPLCEKVPNKNYYRIIELSIMNEDGNKINIYPFYDKSSRDYYFISNNRNEQKINRISPTDKIISVQAVNKYKSISFTGKLTSFRLPADTSASSFVEKPLYLILPFYLLYFIILTGIVFIVTSTLYSINIFFNKKINMIIKRFLNEVLSFLNILTLVVIFILVNIFIQRVFDIQWENKTFFSSVICYAIIQIIIILLFSDNYLNEINNQKNKILNSNEFHYYSLIGMSSNDMLSIYHKKYGRILRLKLIIQNILFVFNINWFVSYAFNVWRDFKDTIGITYSISFENVFTKIVHLDGVNIGWINISILIIINAILFILYYFFQKKLDTEA